MNKSKLLSVLIVAALALAAIVGLVACEQPEPQVTTYTVAFDSNGGASVGSQTISDGGKATEPAAPQRDGYEFVGWFNGETKYDFDLAVTSNLTLTARWQLLPQTATYTVTFDSNGGSSVVSQTVDEGGVAVKPSDPSLYGYNFIGWYKQGESRMYDFSTPVTEDITLIADWDEAQFRVTFDTDGGSDVDSALVRYNSAVARPQDPTKSGCYFEGWYVGEVKYDFETPVTADLTITAKWSDSSVIDAAFTAALNADYSNFTSEMTLTDEGASYTDVFKQTSTLAYWIPESAIYEEHLIIFSESGNMLAMYYLHNDVWTKSNLVTYADFVVALYLDEIELSDVEYSEGVYRVVPTSIDGVVYALFRSNEFYSSLDIIVKDGRIVEVRGVLDEMTHVQTFYDFGKTVITVPSDLPAVTVSIDTKERTLPQGAAIDLDELLNFIFTVIVDGKNFAVTSDMVDLDGLDIDNPEVGEYNIALTFDTWDGATHSKTVKVSIEAEQVGETFADIFGKDYSSVTIMTGSATVKRVNDAYWLSSTTLATYFIAENDDACTLSMYKESTTAAGTFTRSDGWNPNVLRVDLLFALNYDIFEQQDDSNLYVAKNNESLVIFLTKTCMTKSMKINTLRDYSVSLTVELGRVSKISVSYYSLAQTATATASNGSLRTLQFTLTDFGNTEFELPQAIKDLRNPSTAEQTAILYDGKRSA